MTHACKTPGAIYTITMRGGKIACEVALPNGIAIPRDQRHLKVVIHQAMEAALAHLWKSNYVTVLSGKDYAAFVKALDEPSEPTQVLIDLMRGQS